MANQDRGKRRWLSICCIMWILVPIVFLSSYVYRAVQFEKKVRIYSTKIEVGMKEFEVYNLLGRYTRIERDHTGYYMRVIYEGKPFCRDDIVLTFTISSGELVIKERRKFAILND